MKKLKILNPLQLHSIKGGKVKCNGLSTFTKGCVTIETKLCTTLEINRCVTVEVRCPAPFTVVLDDGSEIGW